MAETKINANQTNITASDIGALSASNESSATVGQVLTKTATGAEWDDAQGGGGSLPDMTGQSGKFLTNDGTDASWGTINALQNTATGTESLTIGSQYPATGNNSVNIGHNTYSDEQFNVAIGEGATTSAYAGIAIGRSAEAAGSRQGLFSTKSSNGIAIGFGAKAGSISADKPYSIALGVNASSTGARCMMINIGGGSATNSDDNTVKIANANGNFEMMQADGTIPAARHAALPSADGTYVLKLVIANGVPTLSWVAE